ncbi:hypothetical protein E4U23_002968 [Claviceps purpurea]|nr:hypothetical protein E4U23_002968 [Claviceps purpurea]
MSHTVIGKRFASQVCSGEKARRRGSKERYHFGKMSPASIRLQSRIVTLKGNAQGADRRCDFPLKNNKTIEYQKRGLPHMHLVLWINGGESFQNPERVDEVV